MLVTIILLAMLFGTPLAIFCIAKFEKLPVRGFDLSKDLYGESAAYRWFNPRG